MRTTLSPARGRAILLYAGVAVFVLLSALTARTVWRAWNERAGQARTAAVFELVQQRMPSRPIEAPGAIAWLREQLTTYRAHLRGSDASTFERLSDETESMPAELAAATKAMRAVVLSATEDHLLPPAHSPSPGGLGLFLTEVLSNAMRHGAAGSSPHLAIQCDRVRKEFVFSVENRRRDDAPRPPSKYGGLSLLSGMARLFGWKDFSAAPDGVVFMVSWRAPLTRRDQPGKPD